jgi:hypothetical protein
MFVGHLAVALGAKRSAPHVNLGWLMAGVTALDLIWPIFIVTGVEHATIAPGATAFTPIVFDSYPWSHSLLMSVVWGIVLAALAKAAKVHVSPGLLIALVVSHWVLDLVTHAPDLPLWPGPSSPRLGLTLWNSIPGTIVIEGAMWIAGIAVYMSVARQSGRRPGWPFWSFVAISTVMWMTGPFSPPPSQKLLGWLAMIGWIIIPWTVWADRTTKAPQPESAAA